MSVPSLPRGTAFSNALNGTMPAASKRADRYPLVAFGDSCLRGTGQVCFMNNPVSGAIILLALFLYGPWHGTAAILGLVASTATAYLLEIPRPAIRAGLYGFNGILVGVGFATFLTPAWNGAVLAYIGFIGALSTIVMAALTNVLAGRLGVPPLTLPFNIVTLAFLVAAVGLARGHTGAIIEPQDLAIAESVDSALRPSAEATGSYSPAALANALFRGISQLFLADSMLSGILIIIGMAVCSRIAAGFALLGSALGGATAIALGADGIMVYHGLWGYNSYVSAVAIAGVFFVLTTRTTLLSVACAVAAAILFATLSALFAPWGMPPLTLPFCVATIGFLLLKGVAHRVDPVPLDYVSTPEEHVRFRSPHVHENEHRSPPTSA